jgi:hypothetical protein
MISKWVKAIFLIVLGIVILLFADKLVQDLRTNAEGHFDVAFEWTWDLITWLLWILVAWLFVDAALTIVLSFTEQRHTIGDVARRLERIEKKLGITVSEIEEKPPGQTEEIHGEEPSTEAEQVVEEPPPPT